MSIKGLAAAAMDVDKFWTDFYEIVPTATNQNVRLDNLENMVKQITVEIQQASRQSSKNIIPEIKNYIKNELSTSRYITRPSHEPKLLAIEEKLDELQAYIKNYYDVINKVTDELNIVKSKMQNLPKSDNTATKEAQNIELRLQHQMNEIVELKIKINKLIQDIPQIDPSLLEIRSVTSNLQAQIDSLKTDYASYKTLPLKHLALHRDFASLRDETTDSLRLFLNQTRDDQIQFKLLLTRMLTLEKNMDKNLLDLNRTKITIQNQLDKVLASQTTQNTHFSSIPLMRNDILLLNQMFNATQDRLNDYRRAFNMKMSVVEGRIFNLEQLKNLDVTPSRKNTPSMTEHEKIKHLVLQLHRNTSMISQKVRDLDESVNQNELMISQLNLKLTVTATKLTTLERQSESLYSFQVETEKKFTNASVEIASLKENMMLDETFGIESRELVVAVSEKSDRNFGSINSLRSENSVVNRQITALQKDIKFLQAGLENTHSSNKEQVFSKAELNFKKHQQLIDDLQHDLERVEINIAETNEKVYRLTDNRATDRENIATLTNEYSKIESELDTLSSRPSVKSSPSVLLELQNVNNTIKALRKEVDFRYQTLLSKVDSHDRVMESYDSKLTTRFEHLLQLERILNPLSSRQSKLEQDMGSLQSQINSNKQDIFYLKPSVTAVKSLNQTLIFINDRINDVTDRIGHNQLNINMISEKIGEIRYELNQDDRTMRERQNQNKQQFSLAIQRINANIAQLNATVKEYTRQVGFLRDRQFGPDDLTRLEDAFSNAIGSGYLPTATEDLSFAIDELTVSFLRNLAKNVIASTI